MWWIVIGMMIGTKPVASDVRHDESIVFFPSYAYRQNGDCEWTAVVRGVVFDPRSHSLRKAAAVKALRYATKRDFTPRERKRFDHRVGRFLVDPKRDKTVVIRVGTRECEIGRSGADGQFRDVVRLPKSPRESSGNTGARRPTWISFEAVTRGNREFTGRIQLIGPRGLSIISDIDDTIRDSHVTDKAALLTNTFVHPFRPVTGMPALYRTLAGQGVVVHYVSSGPWQLYQPLAEFLRAEKFPDGSVHLQPFHFSRRNAARLFFSPATTKPKTIAPLLAAFPGRRFVLIGDSGEQDPEIFGNIARRHKRQIVGIFIRDVHSGNSTAERFRKAFDGLDRSVWQIYDRAEQLQAAIKPLASRYREPAVVAKRP